MANTTDITTILTNLGFELDSNDEGFVEDVVRLAEAGDVQALANRIAGGASQGDAMATAHEIVESLR